jgi:hypothetical protein
MVKAQGRNALTRVPGLGRVGVVSSKKSYQLVKVGKSRGAATHIEARDGRPLCVVVWTEILDHGQSATIRNVAGKPAREVGRGWPTCAMCADWALEKGEAAGLVPHPLTSVWYPVVPGVSHLPTLRTQRPAVAGLSPVAGAGFEPATSGV